MADQPITGLPTKTASGVASTDKMLGIDSAEGYQILVRDVAKYIIENCDVSTLAGAVRTPKAAIDLLNSNLSTEIYTGTVSEFLSSLQTLGNSMMIGTFKYINYTPSETTGKFVGGHIYGGLFNRTGSNYWTISLTDPEGNPVYGVYRNGIWVWDRIAIGAEVDALNSHTLTQATANNEAIDSVYVNAINKYHSFAVVDLQFKPKSGVVYDTLLFSLGFNVYNANMILSIGSGGEVVRVAVGSDGTIRARGPFTETTEWHSGQVVVILR